MTTPSLSPVAEGEVIAGKYRIEHVLGKGGMGVIVAATHLQLRQRVAIKFLLANASPEATERFNREARSAGRLKSEHVARMIGAGELPTGAPYMVMEYLQGADLAHVLRERGPFAIDEAVEYVLHACEAIAEAHAAGIVHRDLKPANLFLTKSVGGAPTVKVLDFGISKEIAGDTSGASDGLEMALTRTSALLGSPLYMSPEQMTSPRTVDGRADIWSLGAILYELITGRVPFVATTYPELILMIDREGPPRPSKLRPELPQPLEAAILRCLEKDIEKRLATVADVARAIAPYGKARAQGSAEPIPWLLSKPAPAEGAPPQAPENHGEPPATLPVAAAVTGALSPAAGQAVTMVSSSAPSSSPASLPSEGTPNVTAANAVSFSTPDARMDVEAEAMETTESASSLSSSGEPAKERRRGAPLITAIVVVAACAVGALIAMKVLPSRAESVPALATSTTIATSQAYVPAPPPMSTAIPSADMLVAPAAPAALSAGTAPAASETGAPSPAPTSSAARASPLPQATSPSPAAARPTRRPASKKNPLDIDIK